MKKVKYNIKSVTSQPFFNEPQLIFWKDQIADIREMPQKKDNSTSAPPHEGYDLQGRGPKDPDYDPTL